MLSPINKGILNNRNISQDADATKFNSTANHSCQNDPEVVSARLQNWILQPSLQLNLLQDYETALVLISVFSWNDGIKLL